MTLYFITGNKNKLKEAQAIIPDVQSLDIDLPEIQSMDPKEIIEEKLKSAQKHHQGKFFVGDTSVGFDCLNGFPGPQIKWLLESIGSEEIAKLVRKYENHKASATVIIGFSNNKEVIFFESTVNGKIVLPKVKTDFGWDNIFVPEDRDKTYAEMTQEEKNKISVRRIVLNKLKDYLDNS